jgi:uncharacterized surface protein with fasciclin (FAS1) repeats
MTKFTTLALMGMLAVSGTAFAQAGAQPAKPAKHEDKKHEEKKHDDKAAKPAATAEAKDIVDTAMGTGSHNTLAAALKAAGLVETLKGKGPFTVFAPTDDAFKKLPAGTLDNLLKPENKKQLTEILTYHVIPGSVMAADVVKMKESAKTVQGSTFKINVKDGKVSIGNNKGMANVTATDVKCSNGVIHVIDAVIMPVNEAAKEEHKGEGKPEAKPAGKPESKPEGKKPEEHKKGG